MSNVAEMIDTCFRHQHPEVYGRPEILPEFPPESNVGAEPSWPGMNGEGIVWPEVEVVNDETVPVTS